MGLTHKNEFSVPYVRAYRVHLPPALVCVPCRGNWLYLMPLVKNTRPFHALYKLNIIHGSLGLLGLQLRNINATPLLK